MLELQDIGFDADKEILQDVDLQLDRGLIAITGPNGGGKSTLAKIIMGLIRPTQGKVLLDGEDITDCSVTERANRGISFAFQQPVRFKGLTVQDLIVTAAGKDISLSEACDYLSEVGLCARDYIHRELNDTLSGGEMKRVEIAMLLARGSRISIFDEPEAGIDLWSFQNLIQVFGKMQKTRGGLVLVITHQERILNTADKIIYLKDGKVESFGDREEILGSLTTEISSGCQVLTEKMEGGRQNG